uniref:beta-N-acetylhexosaminidase n=1 Tax=Syphacia muris TaxID=451379 RepID=A0A0N5AQR0_9BILA
MKGSFCFIVTKIVHFDLKGAPPKVNYIIELINFFKSLGINGILLEYEDMFPYTGDLEYLRRPDCYSESEIRQIIQIAQMNEMEVIPLVQTFGHLEFVLKHNKFKNLRENQSSPDTICPSKPESFELLTEMLQQIRRLHVNSTIIHIGADEAQFIGQDRDCEYKLNMELSNSVDRLKLWHITRIASLARKTGFREVWAWNDMFGKIRTSLLVESGIGNLLTPIVWGYSTDVTTPGYFPGGMFKRFSSVFNKMLFGSAFKGANGIGNAFIDVFRYLSNQMSYVELLRKNSTELHNRVSGIVLTGWQRYNHFAPLCELMPVGIPSLVLAINYLDNIHLTMFLLKATLGCPLLEKSENTVQYGGLTLAKPFEEMFRNGTFPGHEVFDLVNYVFKLFFKVYI